MGKNILGVILAALAMFTWGFIYWGASPLPYQSWKHTNDDEAAGQALLEHFPESGTYYLPGFQNDEKTTLHASSKRGPSISYTSQHAKEDRSTTLQSC